MTLDDPVTSVKGIGQEAAGKLAKLGIHTIADLTTNYPRRYDDFSRVELISHIKPGTVTIKATIKQATGRYVRRGMHITEAVASDASGSIRLVWFNQPYRATSLKPTSEYYISGEFALRATRLCITNPAAELVTDFPVQTARIIPIYRETKGFKSTQVRRAMREITPLIRTLPETLPGWIISQHKLLSRSSALMAIHFPESSKQLEASEKRLGFEEVFGLSLAALINKNEFKSEHVISIPFKRDLAQKLIKHLPFTLTDDQKRAIWQIYLDIAQSQPMNRLLEGDVGSGKTVVAAMAAAMAIDQTYQVALMAPTELLARQHFDTIREILTPLGFSSYADLLVGGLAAKQKLYVQKRIKSGECRFMIGTNALIQEKVKIDKLGLIIVDEQHRFGVDQRKQLQTKAGHAVHVLNMTATPIPRSLALTLYGELDISVIASKPPGRRPVLTKIASPNSRDHIYSVMNEQLATGKQMFVVCPLITDSEQLPILSVEQAYKNMQYSFKNYRIGLLHGKQKADDKDAVMQQFVRHEIDILVSTTVIEVGVNVPNATIMLIENAERFGLAQIHQLRGRVGRSDDQGYCYLMLGDSSAPSRRLRALESSSDGFKLAELDLEIRGPGAIYGTSQHGQLDLRIAKLSDYKLIAAARNSAQSFIDQSEDLLNYEQLAQRVNKLRAVTNLN
ncbi:MAG: ATP-dependent DNA helicase RecG [Candidatus Saccharimonadales bacterium]